VSHLYSVLPLLGWPFVACLSMGLLHGYAGLHVLRRGVIFVDLALAQMAALGAVAALFFATHATAPTLPDGPRGAPPPAAATTPAGGDELDQILDQRHSAALPAAEPADEHAAPGFLDLWPTAFALGGAVLLSLSRMRSDRVPHEAIIGVVYVVAAAATVLLLSKSPHGHEQMEEMLTGKLLFVDRGEVLTTGLLYAALGVLHVLFYRPFLRISTSAEQAEQQGMRVRLWDMLFYAMFAIMVTRSVAIAGVLVVFSFLIIPGACAAMFVREFKTRILIAWLVATVVSGLGMLMSATLDLPSGSTVVATFGAALVLCYVLSALVRRRAAGPAT
jgi:zinc/manganese transport system permease protein